MQRLLLAVSLVLLPLVASAGEQPAAPRTLKTAAPQTTPAALYAPDGQHYVAWVDVDPGPPIGESRMVVFRHESAEDFSFVTFPGHTQAAWNSASTRCVISDQPNNGEVFVWLIYQEKPDKWRWRKIDPLAPVYAVYRRAMGDKDLPLFRPYLDKIEWLTDTQVRFLIWCNLGGHTPAAAAGRYHVTIDCQTPDAAPTMVKISDR